MPLKESGNQDLSLGAIADGKFLKRSGTNIVGDDPGGGSLPAGLIVLWHGLLSAIPSGWALCDGTSGTPDLRSKFVKGAAAGQDPGATGGAATHTHDDHAALQHAGAAVDAHASHTHTYSQVPNHVHVQQAPTSATGSQDGLTRDTSTTGASATGISTANPTGGVAQGTTDGPSASLTHAVTQPNDHAAQAHAAANHEPAYYAIAYIMKT